MSIMPVLVRIGNVGEALERRHGRPAADVDEDLRRFEQPVVDADVRGLSKRPWPSISVTLGAFRSQFVTPAFDCATISSLRALTRAMSTAIGPSITTPKSAAAARDVRGARARDQRLGRNAADVDAGAADELALEDRGLAAGTRRAGRPATGRPARCR